MSNHQMKADISAEFVGPLLKRLKLAKEQVLKDPEMEKFINEISPEVVKTKDFLNSREKLDRELVGHLGKIERQIDSRINQKDNYEVGESSNTCYQMDEGVSKVQEFKDLFESLNECNRNCLNSLGMFPENTELKKTLVIYWWATIYTRKRNFNFMKDLKNSIEQLISRLINKKVLIPVHREQNKAIDRFTIEPTFHKWLTSNIGWWFGGIHSKITEEGSWRFFNGGPRYFRILLNLDQRYLNSNYLRDISRKYDNLGLVQLGSWRCTERGVHIEVDQSHFLKNLDPKVSYLSLRGISGITELPELIGILYPLRILDLRACHNLENLPQKPKPRSLLQKIIRCAFSKESIWFNMLSVLDISECYLLDHMPKWVCELHNLQVLKGFVGNSLGNKNQSCRLGDLSELKYLEKLSIRFTNDILSPDVFQGFISLNRLSVLTITWGENKHKEIPTYYLPKNLEKLDMRRYPEADASKWKNHAELTNLKRLYIRGGNLTEIPGCIHWKVEILRLRFLEKLVHPTNWEELRSSFRNLKYVEYVGCPKPINFPNKNGSTWRNEE